MPGDANFGVEQSAVMLFGPGYSGSEVGLAELNFQPSAPPKPACARHRAQRFPSQALRIMRWLY
jgi:hypothetical protein